MPTLRTTCKEHWALNIGYRKEIFFESPLPDDMSEVIKMDRIRYSEEIVIYASALRSLAFKISLNNYKTKTPFASTIISFFGSLMAAISSLVLLASSA